jgi:Fe-S-cluster containining protein
VSGGGRRRRRSAEQLADVYAAMPTVACKGLCQAGCASVGMTPLEQQQIRVRHGVSLPLIAAFGLEDPEGRCPALTEAGRCSVYDSRPFVCRAYGVTESLRCPYGCEPDGGMWPERDSRLAMAKIEEISGNRRHAAVLRQMAGPPPASAAGP